MDGEAVCEDYKTAYENDPSNKDESGNISIPDEYKYQFKY